MSAYFVAQITIHDESLYEQYLAGTDAVLAKFRGEVVAVDDHPAVLEGEWNRTRIVLIRFPDEAELRRWYESPEYQAIARHRWAASEADVLLVHGRRAGTGPVLVSACLVGCRCRYNAEILGDERVERLLREGRAIPVCPEQMGGLSTPRLPCEIAGGTGEDVLNGTARVVDSSGRDVTDAFLQGAADVLKLARALGAETAVLKERSPSCGSSVAYDGTFSGVKRPGMGVTAALLHRNGIRVISEESFPEGY